MAGEQEIAKLVVRLRAETGEMKKELQGAKGSIQSFASDIKKILVTIGAAMGIRELLGQVKQLVQFGVEYNSQIEQQILGIGSLIAATGDVLDSEGKRLEGMEKLNAATEIARDLYDQLRIKAMATTATTPELVEAFQLMVAPGREANLTLSQMVDLATDVVQAMKAMGLPLIQSRMEMRGLLTGEENIRMDIMQRLQIEGAVIKKMREQGKLYEYLSEKLNIFRLAGEKQLTTYEGMKSSLKDILGMLTAAVTFPMFEVVKNFIGDLIKDMVIVEGKTIKFTESAQSMAGTVKESIKVVIEHFKNFKDEYGGFLTLIGTLLKGLNQWVLGFFTGLSVILTAATAVIYYFIKALDILTAGKFPVLAEGAEVLKKKMDQSWASTVKQADALNNLITGTAKLNEEVKKGGPTPTAPPGGKGGMSAEQKKAEVKAFEELTKKLNDYKVALIELKDPMEADRQALENFIKEKMKDVIVTPRLIKIQAELRTELEKVQTAMREKKAREEYLSAFEKITEKTEELKLEMLKLKDPLKADQAELDQIVDKILEGIPPTDALNGAVQRLKKGFMDLKSAQREQAEVQAKIDAELQKNLQTIETETTRTEIAYKNRQMSVEDYYTFLRTAVENTTQAEIDALVKKLNLAKTEDERIKIRSDIESQIAQMIQKRLGLYQEETEEIKKRKQEEAGLRELEINQKLAEIEVKRNTAMDSEANLLRQEIDLQKQRLQIYVDLLPYISSLTDPQGYISVQNQITEVTKRLNDLNLALREQTDTWLEGAKQGWREYYRDITTNFNAAKEFVKGTLSSMQTTFKTLFIDAVKGELKGWRDYFKMIADDMLNILGEMISKMVIKWAMGMADMKSEGGGLLGLVKSVAGFIGGLFSPGGGATAPISTGVSGVFFAQEGGLLTQGSGIKDDVTLKGMKGEFMEPKGTVQYYGAGVMEALRQRVIPKELFRGFSQTLSPAYGYQAGGPVRGGGGGQTISIYVPVNVEDPRLASRLRDAVEETVLTVLKEYTR